MSLPAISYGLAAVGYLVLWLLLVVGRRETKIARALAVAVLVTFTWSGLLAVSGSHAQSIAPGAILALEIARSAIWIWFLTTVFRYEAEASLAQRIGRWTSWFCLAFVIFLLSTFVVPTNLIEPDALLAKIMLLLLVLALLTLFLLEQLYRNARYRRRDGPRFVCIGIGIVAVYDLYLYSNASLIGSISQTLWDARGLVYVCSVPFLAIGARRIHSWSVGLFVSRHIVFFSTTLLATGGYFLVMALVGFAIRSIDADWGPRLQIAFFFAAVALLSIVLFSDQIRRKLRVWIAKHFYENKYDYRVEWLRLIDTLDTSANSEPLGQRCIQAFAEIVGSPSGRLWLENRAERCYRVQYAWNQDADAVSIALDHQLVLFLDDSRWTLDFADVRRNSESYPLRAFNPADVNLGPDDLIIPLQSDDQLMGFVSLTGPIASGALDYEDHDFLKTVGQQVASYLGQELSKQQLAEHRQFEAFNKLTAFMMHDLKNLIAQQSLIVQNAERHKENPAFVDDAFATIANSVRRMQSLLAQLTERSQVGRSSRVDLQGVMGDVMALVTNRQPQPSLELPGAPIVVEADKELITSVLKNLVQNGQEASDDQGTVEILVERTSVGQVAISIRDNGCGMDEEFMKTKLFQPFVSSKGSQGMGIGAYQAREYIQSLGGALEIVSDVGDGTLVSILLPAVGTTRNDIDSVD